MTEWQPIGTAPKDGTQVILLVNGRAFAGRYVVTERFENGKLITRYDGWIYGYNPLGGRPEPTHWFALPALP